MCSKLFLNIKLLILFTQQFNILWLVRLFKNILNEDS